MVYIQLPSLPALTQLLGAIQVLRNAFFLGNWTPTHPPCNANNVEPYTFVKLFPEMLTPPSPSVLRNTWMAPYQWPHST